MRKNLVAQGIAVLIGGLVTAGAANAQVITAATQTVRAVPFANNLAVTNGGIGHINIVPYYTVQNGNDTYFNIINADTYNGKAVKVRFRAASNSDDVFDITVLLSPGDSWAAAVTRGTNGLPLLKTSDRTCTLPGGVGQDAGASFVTNRLDSTKTGEALNNEAREGYIEILNMADIPPVLGTAATGDPGTATAPGATNPLYTAIKHVNGVPPCTGPAINALTTRPTTYAQANTAGMDVPTTGLMTSWVIINVPRTKSFSGNAVAVVARQGTDESSPAGFGNIVFFPQTPVAVPAGTPNEYTTDPLLIARDANGTPNPAGALTAAIPALSFDFPDLSTPYFVTTAAGGTPAAGDVVTPRQQAQELTQALAVTSVSNEYVTDPVVLGKTDWVFSSPTRRYSVAFNYAGTTAGPNTATGRLQFTDISLAAGAGAPGVLDRDFFTAANTSVVDRQICVGGINTINAVTTPATPDTTNGANAANRVNGVTADREERFLAGSTEFVVSPGRAADPLTFCGEVSVLSFNASTTSSGLTGSVLGATVARKDLTFAYANGWLRLETPGLALPNATDVTVGTPARTARSGLPIVGTAMIELFNSAVSTGFSGGFGVTLPHRVTSAVVRAQ